MLGPDTSTMVAFAREAWRTAQEEVRESPRPPWKHRPLGRSHLQNRSGPSSKMSFTGRLVSMQAELVESALRDLRSFLSDRVTAGLAAREHHSHDESSHRPALPDLVCFPQSTVEVSRIIAVSAQHKLPIVPFGAGTSLEGQVHAVRGGISIDMRRMNQILRISVEDMDVAVEAGVTRVQLANALESTGLTFFIDPGADATLGGMASTRASGTTAVRYGTMRENVLGLTVVLADGRVIYTGTRARKSSAGYDLTHLFVGAEGTPE